MHKIGKWEFSNLHTEIGSTDTTLTYVLTMQKKNSKKVKQEKKYRSYTNKVLVKENQYYDCIYRLHF